MRSDGVFISAMLAWVEESEETFQGNIMVSGGGRREEWVKRDCAILAQIFRNAKCAYVYIYNTRDHKT